MTVVHLGRDLMTASRVFELAARAGVEARRLDHPAALPDPGTVSVLVVDWGEREPDWGDRIVAWLATVPREAQPRVLLFGPHVDLDAHAAAKAAGLGPMKARSSLAAEISRLLA